MDILTLSLAAKKAINQLEDEGKVGRDRYTEGHIRWDGDTTDKMALSAADLGVESIDGEYVKISDQVIFAQFIESIEATTLNGKNIAVFNFRVENNDGITAVRAIDDNGNVSSFPYLFVFDTEVAPMNGVYVLVSQSQGFYVSQINGNYVKTTTPIKPEYLPGVCLPVVELEIDTMPTKIEWLPAEKSAEFTPCIGAPLIIRIAISGVVTAELAPYIYAEEKHCFESHLTGLQVISIDGVNWGVQSV